ncbi:MAG: hypothetical protein LC662_09990 [Rhodothermaceae bacterium]|nr:hypothetical protein [Rhodothermaceae bacterium]
MELKAMFILILTILSIVSCSDSELKTDSPVLHNDPAVIQNIHISLRYIGFETIDQLIIAKLPANNEYNLDKFSQFNQISTEDYKIILLSDTEQISISVSEETEYDLSVDGIIILTKNTNNSVVLSEYIESLNDIQENCWSGGDGTKSCSIMYRGSEVYVTCRTSYFACCNQNMTGLCVAS